MENEVANGSVAAGEGNEVRKAETRNLVIILCTLAVLAVGLGVGVVMNVVNTNDSIVSVSANEEKEIDFFEREMIDAENEPNAQEYIAEMEQEIAAADTPEEQAQLYIRRAEELYSRQNVGQGDFSEQILSDVYKAEEIAPSLETAMAIYNFERAFGSDDTASYYYNLAIERGYDEKGESA